MDGQSNYIKKLHASIKTGPDNRFYSSLCLPSKLENNLLKHITRRQVEEKKRNIFMLRNGAFTAPKIVKPIIPIIEENQNFGWNRDKLRKQPDQFVPKEYFRKRNSSDIFLDRFGKVPPATVNEKKRRTHMVPSYYGNYNKNKSEIQPPLSVKIIK